MIDHVMRSRDGMKIHVVELFDPLGIEYCTFWFYSVVEKARHLFITPYPSDAIFNVDETSFILSTTLPSKVLIKRGDTTAFKKISRR
jgi:hypothetical protein